MSVVPKVSEGKCNYPGVTDEGIISAANIARLGAIAVATINTLNAIKMAKLQKEIADRYHQMAAEGREYFNGTFKPCEQSAVAEACSAPLYARSFDNAQIGRMLVTAKAQRKDIALQTIKLAPRYNTGLMATVLKDTILANAGVEATMIGFGIRYEEDRERARNDVRWSRRSSILDLGRDLLPVASTYAQLAAGIFGRLGNQLAQGASAAIGWAFRANEMPNEYLYPVRRPLELPPSTRYLAPQRPSAVRSVEGPAEVGIISPVSSNLSGVQ